MAAALATQLSDLRGCLAARGTDTATGNAGDWLSRPRQQLDRQIGHRTHWMITTGVFPVVLDAVLADFGLPPLAIAGKIYHVDDATLEELDRLEG